MVVMEFTKFFTYDKSSSFKLQKSCDIVGYGIGLFLTIKDSTSMAAESDGLVASYPLIINCRTRMTTNPKAAPKRLILTQCNSAISFIKQVGNNKTAIITP